jgi:2-haloacid dehalogenase
MFAAQNYDLKATQDIGYRTAHIRRPTEHGSDQRIDLEANDDWDVCVESLKGLATQRSYR